MTKFQVFIAVLMLVLSGVIAAATVVYVVFTKKLWKETKKQAEMTKNVFRLNLALYLYQLAGFLFGTGSRRDGIFLRTLGSVFPEQYEHLRSIFTYLGPEMVKNNWDGWAFSHDIDVPRGTPAAEWKGDKSTNLTIGVANNANHFPGQYGQFTYESPAGREIAWIEFDFETRYDHSMCQAGLDYELAHDPGKWHHTWEYFKTAEGHGKVRRDFDEGVVGLRFTLTWIRGGSSGVNWHLRIHRIVICVVPRIAELSGSQERNG